MVLVIILTSIMAGLAFAVLTLVQKQMLGIQDNFNRNAELNLLEQSLWLDFNRYSTIGFDGDENELRFSTELDSVHYAFKQGYIVKERDTFHVPIKQRSLYFQGGKVGGGKVDAIKLETKRPFTDQKLFIFKTNDANQFMD